MSRKIQLVLNGRILFPISAKNLLAQVPTQFKQIDLREILAMSFGFSLALALVCSGDLATGKDIAIMLVGYGIGRSVP